MLLVGVFNINLSFFFCGVSWWWWYWWCWYYCLKCLTNSLIFWPSYFWLNFEGTDWGKARSPWPGNPRFNQVRLGCFYGFSRMWNLEREFSWVQFLVWEDTKPFEVVGYLLNSSVFIQNTAKNSTILRFRPTWHVASRYYDQDIYIGSKMVVKPQMIKIYVGRVEFGFMEWGSGGPRSCYSVVVRECIWNALVLLLDLPTFDGTCSLGYIPCREV